MDRIYQHNKLLAIRIKNIPYGSVPVTEGSEPLQLVTLKHPQGTYLQAHLHTPKKRVTKSLQECLIVKKGKVRLDLYDENKKLFKKILLSEGQTLIMVRGGYGIHLLKDSELIEVKNGPFIEDKVRI